MKRSVLVLLLSACLGCWVAPVALAQAQSKAYAPENLEQLAVPDRIRVIEKEYADQARGRRIPDDQLEFYLDQVESGWSFSQIKQDIATSLGGGGSAGGWRPGPGPRPGPGLPVEVLCESRNDRYTECTTPFRGVAIVARQLSGVRCIEGANFGSRPGMVWVSRGCRARFVEDDRYSAPPNAIDAIVCESRDGRYRECRVPFRGRAALLRQLSSQPCVEGRSWGSRPGLLWVNHGCRASFTDARGGGRPDVAYSVTCASTDGRYRTCAWNANAGRPQLLEQTSGTACIEGRTWGYDRREGLWVDRGCRGRFGAY
jgi:hypothetical protein